MKRMLLAMVIALTCLTAAAADGLRVVYGTTRTAVSSQGSSTPGEKVTRESMSVVLLPSALVVRSGEQDTVYDFGSRRVTTLDHAKQISKEYAFYAWPAFLEREIVNRQAIYRMAREIDLSRDVDMIDAESQLSMTAEPPTKLKFSEKKQGETRVFLLNGREATLLTPSATAIPQELRHAFTQLLLQSGALHPRVREQVVADGRLPQRLEFRWREIGERNAVVWELQETAAESVDVAALSAKYPRQPLESEGLVGLAWRVSRGEFGAAPAAAAYAERAERLLDEGRRLEALLVALECSYATGTVDDALLKKTWEASAVDPQAQAVRRATQIEVEKGSPQEALALLEAMKLEGLEGAASVHIMRAMQRINAGQHDHALQDFAYALAINPLMVGPWMDAGRIYHDSYRTHFAWACWDAVRAFAPGAESLKQIDQREADLVRKHPEFF